MVNIIRQTRRGKNFQVPGLPYDDTRNYSRTRILDEVPTADELERLLLEEQEPDTVIGLWPKSALLGFREYIPTSFRRVWKGLHDPTGFFGPDLEDNGDRERVLLQLQTELDAKSATIDAAVAHNRASLGTIVNKAHHLNRLYIIGRQHGFFSENEYPMLFGDLRDPTNWTEALIGMKYCFNELKREIPLGKRNYDVVVRKPHTNPEKLRGLYPFIDWFEQKLGDNLAGILLYGSAARTEDPNKFSDYDNWVRVHDVGAAVRALAHTAPSVVDGKVIEGYHADDNPMAKHVGIHIIPADDEHLLRHIRFLHDPTEFLKHTRVLTGHWPFPKVDEDEVLERGLSHAYIKLKTLCSSLDWAYREPERVAEAPALFEFLVKNLRFFLQHTVNAIEGPAFRHKDALNKMLEDRGCPIPEYKNDPRYIQEALLSTTVAGLKMQAEFQAYGRKPNLDFLKE